jgi:RNA recognition motif-containing protein
MDIFIGNLPLNMDKHTLIEFFEPFGEVTNSRIIVDKFSGISRGFGFVDMPNNKEAFEAIKANNGKEIQGNKIIVESSLQPPRGRNI